MIWFKANLVFLVVSVISAIGIFVWWIPRLPPQIPIHFDGNMVADHIVPSSQFLWTFALIQLGALSVFVGLSVGIRYIPISLVNLPNREYWLTGERRADSLNWLSGMLMLIASAETWLLTGLFQMSIQIGQGSIQTPAPAYWTMIVMFVAICVGVAIYSLVRFRKPALER